MSKERDTMWSWITDLIKIIVDRIPIATSDGPEVVISGFPENHLIPGRTDISLHNKGDKTAYNIHISPISLTFSSPSDKESLRLLFEFEKVDCIDTNKEALVKYEACVIINGKKISDDSTNKLFIAHLIKPYAKTDVPVEIIYNDKKSKKYTTLMTVGKSGKILKKGGTIIITSKIKRLIAREGLVILAILLIIFVGGIIHHIWWWNRMERYVAEHPLARMNTIEDSFVAFAVILFGLYVLQWIIRLIIRFIIWAVRTLREK